MNEKKEIWKPYPEFGLIQGSNWGNVRIIGRWITTKDGRKYFKNRHVLPQHCDKDGYMQVTFTVNGKTFILKVHRIVAMCFLKNEKQLPQVNHKNCIRDDNRLTNLEWCDASYNNQYREEYGEAFGRPLWAFDLKTGKKLQFRSQHEAGRETGVSQTSINQVIKGKLKQAGGYWFTEDKSKITKDKIREIKAGTHFFCGVIAVSSKATEFLRFKSRAEAARSLGFSASSIGDILAGRHKQTHGYWFTRADENAVESTRAKFGDEVANKVAELMAEN